MHDDSDNLTARVATGAEPVEARRVRRTALVLLALGAAGLLLALWGLWRDVGWIAQPFYAYAWWSYILILDGLTALARGSSLLTRRRGQLWYICLWSVTFWFFFELLNLRFRNWYYVGVYESRSLADALRSGVYTVACFSTVFTGIFETYDALTAAGLFRGRPTHTRRFAPQVSYAIQALGMAGIAVSVLWPHYLAPLVWGCLTLVIDPLNYRLGARSLLRDVEHGRTGVLLRALVAGLICGLVWESLNFFAPQKWIYTVRGLEELKLFEMPLLGFLGFPALALDSFAAYALVAYLFHGNRSWEHPRDVEPPLARRAAISRGAFALTFPLHVAFWAAITLLVQDVNIGSVELRLHDLRRLPPGGVETLRELELYRPRQLVQAAGDAMRRERIRSALGLSSDELSAIVEEIRLYEHKGIGHHHGRTLQRVGIRTVDDLRRADPQALYERMVAERDGRTFPALRPEMVRLWVRAARPS